METLTRTSTDQAWSARTNADEADALRRALASCDGRRTLAALSGGVDSAVAAALAARTLGVDMSVTMRLWTTGDGAASEKARQCCGPTAFEDARRTAADLGIPHFVVNFESAFQQAVIDYFCAEYLAGRTPNPCVACNNRIKFGALADFARALGAATIVTGHYVRVIREGRQARLLRAVDRAKDQSYMLAGLRPDQLSAIVTPLGAYSKEETRRLARDMRIGVAEKPDSMDLCFVDGDYRGFIERRYPESARPGPVVTTEGRQVGEHDGLLGYTVGQRRGLPATLSDGPWYVVRTDRRANAVVIGRREELERTTLTCSAPNLLRAALFEDGRSAQVVAVCRYRSRPLPAHATFQDGRLTVTLREPVAVATPGQLCVLYDLADEEVLASGVIEAA